MEFKEKKQKLEELLTTWKAAMAKLEYIATYVDYLYDDDYKYSYVVMEYLIISRFITFVNNKKRYLIYRMCTDR
jgi:hypothetical protein